MHAACAPLCPPLGLNTVQTKPPTLEPDLRPLNNALQFDAGVRIGSACSGAGGAAGALVGRGNAGAPPLQRVRLALDHDHIVSAPDVARRFFCAPTSLRARVRPLDRGTHTREDTLFSLNRVTHTHRDASRRVHHSRRDDYSPVSSRPKGLVARRMMNSYPDLTASSPDS
ncbi:hypothetical protein FRC12_005745 [Ceratobasidium sp. 428]|nr:hypothetical protein FRC12_005745 [Ceratobasidium sp. 428]